MTIYVPPSIRHFVPRFVSFSTWVDHMAFGYDVVADVRPRRLVELGTHHGLSYFTFCQSVQDHDIDAVCHAVDTWEGDEHAGRYDESVFNQVNHHNRENYPSFSYLMRMTFDEASEHFADEDIDLLHIDGLHTYEAVSSDFRRWLPKVRPGGLILFHDTQSRMMDFGVWRFWEEISGDYESFEFVGGYGLGVLRKPGPRTLESELQRVMFTGTQAERAQLRAFYGYAARFTTLSHRARSGAMPPRFGPGSSSQDTRLDIATRPTAATP